MMPTHAATLSSVGIEQTKDNASDNKTQFSQNCYTRQAIDWVIDYEKCPVCK